MAAFLLQKLAHHFPETRQLVFREDASRSVLVQTSLGLVSETHGVFNNRDVPSALCRGRSAKVQPRATTIQCTMF